MKAMVLKTNLFKKRKRKSSTKPHVGSSFLTQRSVSSDSFDGQDSATSESQWRREQECLLHLIEGCRLAKVPASDDMIFRFACFYSFEYEVARSAILQTFDDPHLHLRMEGELITQFQNMVIFPLPGLKSKNKKHEVLYFHACRHFPAKTDTALLIKNLLYVFNDMSLTQEQCRNGTTILIDLKHWTFKNFTPECANKFLSALQHQVPTKVAALLVVNAPRWFPKVYRCVFKAMLTASFTKKLHILKNPQHLQDYLMDGYQKYLPSEMSCGWQDSNEILDDYIDKKVHHESSNKNTQ
ncbi:MAG: hypothetical protein SGBAC_012137 [Bacillariaceae sp.]